MPNVYVTTPPALPIIAATYQRTTGRPWQGSEREQLRSARGYSWQHIRHELAVTGFDIDIAALAESRRDLHFHHAERRYFRRDKRLTFQQNGTTQSVVPDAGYFVTHQRNGRRWLDLCYLRGTMAPHRVRDKCDRYDAWSQSTREGEYLATLHTHYHDQDTQQPTFRLLVVTTARPSERTDFWWMVASVYRSPDPAGGHAAPHLDDDSPADPPARSRCSYLGSPPRCRPLESNTTEP